MSMAEILAKLYKTRLDIILDFRFRTLFGKTTDLDMVDIILIRIK